MLPLDEHGHADPAPREEVDAPDDRLDAEDATVRPRLLDLRRERIPRVGEDARQRPADRSPTRCWRHPRSRSRARAARDRRRRCRRRARRRAWTSTKADRDERECARSAPLALVPGRARVRRPLARTIPTARHAELPADVEAQPRGRTPRARTAAPPRGRSSGSSAPAAESRRPPASGSAVTLPPATPSPKPRLLALAPLDVELGVLDAVPKDEVDERRVLARPRVDLPQEREELLVPGTAHPQLLERLARAAARPRRRASAGSRPAAPASRPGDAAPAGRARARPASVSSVLLALAAARRGELCPSTRPAFSSASARDRSGRSSPPRRNASTGRRFP